mmetsp:Transcript_22187/g.48707  ORF Transcript_22187/g.48707 Transcript_22187/m.48707 type:complete len:133 (-) Transcript_22187:381-779(-)|eukprot:CAMPEP_0118932618 /NCGR_PEP_ID=MMETSP1169-20130426/10530_1 /TAXON_ID=36882 /ORGANISM="Pyramimonas obovata, Strain CCMP722" /LENGTH=132 /DNA_ID=CAMNT_0006875305 /DNA_START=293 /DNA_END=691 /DNA_ORIENTATION=+
MALLMHLRRALGNEVLSSSTSRGFHAALPCFAKAKKGGKGGAEEVEQEVATGKCDLKVATGINILKSGNDPALGPNEAYPDWLWKLGEPSPNLAELQQKGWDNLADLSEKKRLVKLMARQEIKVKNALKAKK